MVVPAPASRNAPCPCGSGKRYKDCHGALGDARVPVAAATPVAPIPDTAALRRRERMQDALACQQAGDLEAAMTGYEAVLAEVPDDFDALHMLGVAHYQRHAFDRAEALLRAAIARNPRVASAQQNLALLLEARRLETAEDALCRAVLPRLAHLCAPPSAFAALADARAGIDLLDGSGGAAHDEVLARLVEGALGPARLHAPVAVPRPGLAADAPSGTLDASVIVLYGLAAPLAAFAPLPPHAARVLVVDRDAPSASHDRLRELSDDARHVVHVRSALPALVNALGVPAGPLFDHAAPT